MFSAASDATFRGGTNKLNNIDFARIIAVVSGIPQKYYLPCTLFASANEMDTVLTVFSENCFFFEGNNVGPVSLHKSHQNVFPVLSLG